MSHINVGNPPIPPQPESLWERWYDAAHVALRQAECLVSEARVLESALDDLLELQEQSRSDEVHIHQTAAHSEPHVFCPPVCAFTEPSGAAAENLAEGVALSVECDANP